ncbi:MAG TPA: Na+/H+ antiporter [Steroidobacteraceae bacterium]|jgi:Na+/H+ antiporter|nr:Na+/H+ antiporter [Steroidobacteraceae bacterium]
MIADIQLVVCLLIVIAVVAIVARRLNIPSPILLVLVGVVLALLPGLPTLELAPDILLLLVLPPVIYSAAVAMSWREFRFNLRPISLLAIGAVIFTTAAVALACHWLLNLSWGVGFVLGAIVSPPDAVAPLAIARRLNLPRRITIILEGEGLANDASALILYRFAVAAVGGGLFSFSHAAGTFLAIVAGELAWGIAVGWTMLRLRRWVADPRVEIVLSVLTPFLAYWPPEHLGGSGVLATVTAGLYISWNGLRLISAATRLQGIFFWDFLIYVIEGLVFLLTGLQARPVLAGIRNYTAEELLVSGAVVSVVVLLTRFAWIYPATYLPRWLIPAISRRDPAPPWQWPFMLGFTGVRGIVSLAAALAIPLTTADGMPFPQRDLLLLLAFAVVLITLVGQGLTLPYLITALKLSDAGLRENGERRIEELRARILAIEAVLERVRALAADGRIPDAVAERLTIHHTNRLELVESRSIEDERHQERVRLTDEVELRLLSEEREAINQLYVQGRLKDETRRKIERELDLREANLASARSDTATL